VPAPTSRLRWFSLDHKTIGVQYAVTALVFLLVGFSPMMLIPVGRPVVIHLTSKHVVHSLSLPQMRVKQNTIPGMMVTVWFVPTRTTDGAPWEIKCSQLCGPAHNRMRALDRSMPQREYGERVRTQLAALAPGSR
jgi:heme/copper-type cytochrome/quinol oxidase subunit 2